jgi:uncharacterized DUF497 family protein
MYHEIMKVTWDPEKAKINLRKHRIRFADAEPVFFDPMALTREDDDSEGEQRFVSLGLDALNRILVVVYTYRGRRHPSDFCSPRNLKGEKTL